MITRPVVCRTFVGRREELGYLRERRREAASSRGGIVSIAGEAGVGKSRLIDEFCRSLTASRFRFARATCTEFGRSPYGPIVRALEALDAASPGAEGGATLASGAASQQQHFAAIAETFEGLAARGGLIVAIEDLHWADVATLNFLEYVGPRLGSMRALFLLSFRPEGAHSASSAAVTIATIEHRARAGRIDLAPLAGRDLQTFIDDALGDSVLAPETRRAVAARAEGNPFFTEELLKSAVERTRARRDGARGSDLPITVRATLQERIKPFDAEGRRILSQAAVIGRTFGLDLLSATTGVAAERVTAALRQARDVQLVDEVTPATFRFRHALTREAMYADFLGAEARPLHRRIALELEADAADGGAVESLAYHWWAAGDGERSSRYNELAGDTATGIFAHEDAIAFYERALESDGASPHTRGALLEKIANRRIVLTMTEAGEAAYTAAADAFRSAGSHEREAGCRVRAAMTAYTLRLTDTTLPLEEMLQRVPPDATIARARVHVGIAWIAAALRFPTRAEAHLGAVNPEALAGTADIALRYHNVASLVATAFGDIPGFRSAHARWLEAARAHGTGAVAGAYYNGAVHSSALGLHDESRLLIDAALRTARASHNRHAEECAYAVAAGARLLAGDLAGARDALEAVPVTTDNRVNVILASAAGSAVAAYLDDPALIAKWFDAFEETILAAPEIECGYGFSELLVRRGRLDDARRLLHRAVPECELLRGNVLTLLAAGRYGAEPDRLRARVALARAAATAPESIEGAALALFDAIDSRRNGRLEEAAAFARAGAEGFARVRVPLLEAAAREIAGDASGALALYRRCGANYDVRRLDGSHPAAESPRAPKHPAMATLSEREREIALLAGSGHSNLEIARSLSISHKTVEKHLAGVFQKLGLSSRRELRPFVPPGWSPQQ